MWSTTPTQNATSAGRKISADRFTTMSRACVSPNAYRAAATRNQKTLVSCIGLAFSIPPAYAVLSLPIPSPGSILA